jgi:hypothetical protein
MIKPAISANPNAEKSSTGTPEELKFLKYGTNV